MLVFFFLGSWGGVRISPLSTSATIWPTLPDLDDGWWWGWVWSNRRNDWQGKQKYSEKSCPIATLSTTNPTWPDPSSNPAAVMESQRLTTWATAWPARRDKKLVKKRLSKSLKLLRKLIIMWRTTGSTLGVIGAEGGYMLVMGYWIRLARVG
jgi:hypothetical protein